MKERGRGNTNELKSFYKLQMENIVHCAGNNYEEMNGLHLLYVLRHIEDILISRESEVLFLGPCQT